MANVMMGQYVLIILLNINVMCMKANVYNERKITAEE